MNNNKIDQQKDQNCRNQEIKEKIKFDSPPHCLEVDDSEIWTYEQFKLNILKTVPFDYLEEIEEDEELCHSYDCNKHYDKVVNRIRNRKISKWQLWWLYKSILYVGKDLTYLASFVEKYLQELKEGIIKNTAESRHLKELLYLMKYNLELEQPLFFKKIWSLLEPEEKKTDTETEEVIIEKDNGENYKQMMTKKLSERDRTVYLTKEFEKHASEIGKRIGTDLKLDDDLTEKLTTAIKENKEFSPRTKRILLIKGNNDNRLRYLLDWFYFGLPKIREGNIITKEIYKKDVQEPKKNWISLEESLKHATPTREKNKVRCKECKGEFVRNKFYSHYRKHIN